MRSIILLGYMCVGKTKIGNQLAKRLNRTFYDLDWYIEDRMHKRIPELFAEKGEDGFRKIERNMLHEAAEFEDIILSCGGGTPCFFDNMDYMNETGVTIFLKASPATIINHYKMSRTVRPLLQNKSPEELKDFITTQLEDRAPFYEKARYTINVDVLDDFDKVKMVVEDICHIVPDLH